MKLDETPLRLLVKSYANGLLDRDQYLDVRQQLLKKLSNQGNITHEDLKNFLIIHQDTDKIRTLSGYTPSDWIIIILGLLAAGTLGFILYN